MDHSRRIVTSTADESNELLVSPNALLLFNESNHVVGGYWSKDSNLKRMSESFLGLVGLFSILGLSSVALSLKLLTKEIARNNGSTFNDLNNNSL
jgi:hypothetical protein